MANTWNQVLPGRAWDFLNPSADAIDWKSVALVLSRIPRFGGHTHGGPYSVAQHLVEGADAILRDTKRRDWAAAYLLHDAHEYVIGDDVRPKIEALAALASWCASKDSDHMHDARSAAKWLRAAYRELQRRADAVIYTAAGLAWPLSDETAAVVCNYDDRMLRTEADARTGPRVASWGDTVENAEPIADADMSVWPARLASALWYSAAMDLLPALARPQSKPKSITNWCDWADGKRPGICEACGGSFGMLARPATCSR